MGSEDYVDYEQNIEDDTANNDNSFRDYNIDETKLQKSSFKKRMAQAKRLLMNQASKEYSQVHEQQEQKSVSKMLVSVSKINGLKGKNYACSLDTKTGLDLIIIFAVFCKEPSFSSRFLYLRIPTSRSLKSTFSNRFSIN